MANRVEVSFNPHGASEEWPQFLAAAGDREDVEYLYELHADGWFCTMRSGGPGGFATAHTPIQNRELEEVLWAGAARLTLQPDFEAFVLHEGSSAWVPYREGASP